jgi:hypothetical protein
MIAASSTALAHIAIAVRIARSSGDLGRSGVKYGGHSGVAGGHEGLDGFM